MKSNSIKLGNVKAHIPMYETKQKHWIWNTCKSVKMCMLVCVRALVYLHTHTHSSKQISLRRSIMSAM